jgi:hypothetical protein
MSIFIKPRVVSYVTGEVAWHPCPNSTVQIRLEIWANYCTLWWTREHRLGLSTWQKQREIFKVGFTSVTKVDCVFSLIHGRELHEKWFIIARWLVSCITSTSRHRLMMLLIGNYSLIDGWGGTNFITANMRTKMLDQWQKSKTKLLFL